MYELHSLATKFPAMPDADYRALVADIRTNGLIHPIILHEGKILDGRHRYRACADAGVEPRFVTLAEAAPGVSPLAFVVATNLHRRDLTPGQRAMLAVDFLPELEAEAKKRQQAGRVEGGRRRRVDKPKTQLPYALGRSREQAARKVGVSGRSVGEAKKIKRQAPEVAERVIAGALTLPEARSLSALDPDDRAYALAQLDSGAVKTVREAKQSLYRRITTPDQPASGTDWQVLDGDFRAVLPTLEAGSVAAIITDPPYLQEYLPLLDDLAAGALQVLKPGGSLVVMMGQYFLSAALQRLSIPGLVYRWTLAYMMAGAHARMHSIGLNVGWKPVLWFTKGDFGGNGFYDVIQGEARDKRFHHWGQDVAGFEKLVERFSRRGELVLDPFAGSATTGVAALRLGRRFVGVDNDPDSVAISRQRLAAEAAQKVEVAK